jgi:nickel/cobalt transporter (NicO) family protein
MTTITTRKRGLLLNLMTMFILMTLVIILFNQWDFIIYTLVNTQKNLHTLLAEHITAIKENRFESGLSLILLSFAYGVFHAIGPGHGKAIIVTYLGTHKESLWRSIFISMSSALLQSVVAVLIVVIVAFVLSLKLSDAHRYGQDITLVSYGLVLALGLLMSLLAVLRLSRYVLSIRRKAQASTPSHPHSHDAVAIHGHSHGSKSDHAHSHDHQHHHDHDHDHGDCGCSHSYVPPKDQTFLKSILVILSMGLRPCSGALVVLIYAHLVGVFTFGIIATVMMGLGSGLSVSLIALGTQFLRQWFEKRINTASHEHWLLRWPFGQLLRLLAGIFLVLFAVSLLSAALVSTQTNPFLN